MALVVPAVLALVALGAAAQACLPCFTSHSQRLRICHMFTGRLGPEQEKCEEAFTAAFRGLLDVEFDYSQRSHLHDTFTQMTHSLEELAVSRGSYKVGFANAARKMKMAISQIKPAQACIPPCGLQDLARLFRCRGCYSRSCNLPLDCPVQDVLVTRGDQAMFSCVVNFQLPQEEISYSWLFAEGGLRTQDVNYFREVPGARGYLARILPVQPKHSGTFSCVIKQDQRLLARLYFFLNVTGPAPRAETELQITFRKVLRWAPQDAELVEPWTPSLGELLARPGTLSRVNLGLLAAAAACVSASATLLAWLFFRWYLSDP
ncbi:sperm acrosome membrane-associated protein 6 isoform X1 [Ochotona princeps]|uniref:sperm acrosome membrane-associated protein 6 isoform X1 n=1 Tax=Ochotona princeps TaxID=9978 RepID=UPI0027152A43|nr:sperm acrosome membrane-associated protein 6 isoform X1 [Ochotona princeps]